ncbi:hypothetical protein OSTOST_22262 [Ostertagia ostertagi]
MEYVAEHLRHRLEPCEDEGGEQFCLGPKNAGLCDSPGFAKVAEQMCAKTHVRMKQANSSVWLQRTPGLCDSPGFAKIAEQMCAKRVVFVNDCSTRAFITQI